MKNRKNLLLLMAMCLTLNMADASSLVQMDIKKTSDNAVDLTFFTTGSTSSPMVTRKSNNKYVILMPNVSGQNAGTPSLSAVKDLITNVDVKNVDDGMNGYTKVTLITTKPINISTHTQKTAPLSSEEKQAKAIIAQAKTHPVQTASTQNITKTKVTSSSTVTKTDNKKTETKKAEAKKTETKVQKAKQQAPQKAVATPAPVQTVQPVSPVKESTVTETTKPVNQVKTEEPVVNMKEVEKIEKLSKTPSHKNYAGLLLLLLPLWLLSLLAKSVRNSVQKSKALKTSFNANLAEKPFVQENYDNIINDKELSWQERYKKFVEESKGEAKMSKYSFIKPVSATKVEESSKTSSATTPISQTTTDSKRLEFERTLSKTPDLYKNTEIQIDETPVHEVQSEDNAIQDNIIKLKAFANPVSLHTTHRGRTKTTLPKLPKAKEGKFVNLKQSEINTTSRHFRGGALSVSDLMKTGSKYINEESTSTSSQDYVMSSVDEYFSILDKEKELMTAPKDLSSKIAGSLSNLKPSMSMTSKSSNRSTNPIKQHRSNTASGLVIKNGYNIDENRGFYIANVDGLNSLIGRINDETFVLKTFDSNIDNLQVRHDSENVYVVKAGDFKALVDVSEDKMGVLLEL